MNTYDFNNITDQDLMDLDDVLSEFIHALLIRFKKLDSRNIVPNDIMKLFKHHEGVSSSKWEEILDEMIYAFSPPKEFSEVEDPYDDENSWISHEDLRFNSILKENKTEEDAIHYRSSYEKWQECEEQRRLNGRILFAKYFNNFWN